MRRVKKRREWEKSTKKKRGAKEESQGKKSGDILALSLKNPPRTKTRLN